MTLDEIERLCEECQNPMGIILKIPGIAKRRNRRKRLVVAGVYGVILAEQSNRQTGKPETVVAVNVNEMRRFVAKCKARIKGERLPIGWKP